MPTFVGVDQTGRATAGGREAASLPAVSLVPEGDAYVLHEHALSGLTPRALEGLSLPPGDWHLVVDSVFWPLGGRGAGRLWELFAAAARFEHQGRRFGRDVAEAFFAQLQPPGPLPRRACEVAAGANSVFASRPYQRNIQTGTFRVWKDLGTHAEPWLNLWPFAEAAAPGLPWLYEGYPSLAWKRLFSEVSPTGPPARRSDALRAWTRARFGNQVRATATTWRALAQDADLADAAVLALAGWEWARQPGPRDREDEGWILGLDPGPGVSPDPSPQSIPD